MVILVKVPQQVFLQAAHGVRFAAARLAVGKHAHVDARERRVHELAHAAGLKQLPLPHLGRQHAVKGKARHYLLLGAPVHYGLHVAVLVPVVQHRAQAGLGVAVRQLGAVHGAQAHHNLHRCCAVQGLVHQLPHACHAQRRGGATPTTARTQQAAQ